MFSRMQTRKDAASPGILSEVAAKVTRMGAKEYVSGYPQNGGYDITAFSMTAARRANHSRYLLRSLSRWM